MAWLAGLLLAGCAGRSGADWPRWRGPGGSAVSDATPLPERWSVVWKTPLPGEGASSPIVSGDSVFVTLALREGRTRVLQCLDRRSGAMRWTVEVEDPDPERTSALTGHAAPTPATDGDRVVAGFGNAGAVCADFAGRVLWRRPLGTFDSELGLASSPILHDGLVILVCDHDGTRFTSFDSFLVALDLGTGEVRWKTPRPGLERSWSTPIVVGGVLVVNGQDELRGYDPATGRLLWQVPGMTGWVTPSPVAGEGLIFATSGKNGPTVAVRADGSVAWREEGGAPYVCSPLYYKGLLYVHDETGILTCREAATGRVAYRARLRGKFTASAVAGDGKVYFSNEEGTTFVVRAGREFALLAENALGEECLASPAIAHGRIFMRTAKHLVCIGKSELPE